MRKFYLFALILISTFSFSQEINEAYLESLPSNIKEDVLSRIDEKTNREKRTYNSRSIDVGSEIKKKNYDELLFGSDFFDTVQTSFMPINTPNLDNDYILDYGDTLQIQLIGQIDYIDSFQIKRDGSINIPDIGKLTISGLSLREVSIMIKAKIKQTYIGTEAYVSLENIRDVSVLVSGNAYNPGIYTLSGASNMLHALHSAGGIGDQGSFRNIQLIREGNVIETLDIYDILINGKFDSKTRLRTGDMIFVKPRSNVVTLEGAFKRPSKYELKDDQYLSDAIYYANGLNASADLSNIFLYRLLDGSIKDISISNISQFDRIKSNDLDRIFVRNHSFRNVSISGAVLRPGNYKMVEGETIFDLINKAGGYTKNAFPKGAVYLNKEAERINIDASERLYSDFIDSLFEVIQKNGTETDISSLVSIASELRNSKPNGRIIVDLEDDSTINVVRNEDSIFIPEQNNNVFIYGEVLNEGALIYKDGGDLDFYLNEASGIKETADNESIFILYANGRTKQFSIKRNVFASQSQRIMIEPGAVIYVPRKIDSTLSSRLTAQAYASILGNIGITLASISAINK